METQSSSESQSIGSQSIGNQSNDSQSTDSQSSGGGRKKGPIKDIPLKLHGIKRTLDDRVGLGVFHLEASYDPETSRFRKDSYPMHFLDVKDLDQIEILKKMKTLSHPNILVISLINQVKGETGVRVYVEPYSGVLSQRLKKMNLVNPKTNLIPSDPCKNIVSEVVDGLNHLRENDEYHGIFSWATTYYVKETSRTITKLANLEKKGSKLLECQAADCVSLGFGLAEISEYGKERLAVPASSCCLIDDLSRQLISVTPTTVGKVMDGIKDHVFFWDEKKRKSFLANDVPEAWDQEAFKSTFIQSESLPAMPWKNEPYDGYMNAMIAYRAANNIEEFNENDWKDFLRCMSGMYTHQTELDVKDYIRPVDSSVHLAHPRLFLDLKAAMDQLPVDQPDQLPVDQPDQTLFPVA